MTPEQLLEQLRRHSAAISAALHTRPWDAPVPSCPGWDLAELGRHLGSGDRWSASAIGADHASRPTEVPHDPGDVPRWYDEGVAELIARLTEAEPDAPAWTFGHPRTAAFWFRRRAHEHAIHRCDAEPPLPYRDELDPEFAADGVVEVAELFFPRVRDRRPALGAVRAVRFLATDTGDEVVFGPGDPAATVHGPAADLYLLAWNRIAWDEARIRVEGDRAAAAELLDVGITF